MGQDALKRVEISAKQINKIGELMLAVAEDPKKRKGMNKLVKKLTKRTRKIRL